MARTKKDRSAEIEAVFNGLKFCSTDQLNEVITKANKLLQDIKKAEIEALEAEIREKQAKLEALKK